MGLVKEFNTDNNFWLEHPDMKIPALYASLYKNDKTKDKKESSRIMWSIALFCEIDSKFYNLQEEERKKLILSDYLKMDIDWDKELGEYVKLYQELNLTQAERSLTNFLNKLVERDQFLNDTPYSLDSADSLDKMMANTSKLYDHYNKIQKMLDADNIEQKGKGGREESLSDSGDI